VHKFGHLMLYQQLKTVIGIVFGGYSHPIMAQSQCAQLINVYNVMKIYLVPTLENLLVEPAEILVFVA